MAEWLSKPPPPPLLALLLEVGGGCRTVGSTTPPHKSSLPTTSSPHHRSPTQEVRLTKSCMVGARGKGGNSSAPPAPSPVDPSPTGPPLSLSSHTATHSRADRGGGTERFAAMMFRARRPSLHRSATVVDATAAPFPLPRDGSLPLSSSPGFTNLRSNKALSPG